MNPIAFGAIFGLSLFGGLGIEKFERAIAKDLGHSMVGDHKSIIVRAKISLETLDGVLPRVVFIAKNFTCESLPLKVEPWRSHYGHIRHLEVEMDHFVLKGLPVERFTTILPDVRFDLAYAMSKHHFRMVRSGEGPVRVELRFQDLQAFLSKKFTQFSDLTLHSDGPRIVATGKASFAGLQLPFELSGVPTVKEESKLSLENASITINGKPVDAKKALALFKGSSNLLDLNEDLGAHGVVHLRSFQVQGDRLIGEGTAKITESQGSSQPLPGDNSGIDTPIDTVSY